MLYHRNLVLPTEKYYVYIHRNPLTHKIFYVGSAKGNPLRAEDQAIAFILSDNLQLVKNMEKLSSNSSAKVNAK